MRGIALFVVPIIVYALPLPATADSKQIRKIKISHYVIAADPQLHPAKHGVRWDRSGPHVQVRFVDERDELVSIPATLIPNTNDLETGGRTQLQTRSRYGSSSV